MERRKLELKFYNKDNSDTIQFLPYGVSTIEFSELTGLDGGFIFPVNNGKIDNKFVGYSDSKNDDFLVVWGAGKEKGQELKSGKRMYFQLINLKEPKEQTITFKDTENFYWSETLRIIPANNGNVVRMIKNEDTNLFEFKGDLIPQYYSRWFPPKQINYDKTEFPKIKIEFKKNNSGIVSPIIIKLETTQGLKKIGSVEGDLDYSNFNAEIFSLFPGSQFFVLRTWFYWIHKNFEGGLLRSLEETGDDTKTLIGNTILEIPDIERFDFIIDAENDCIIWYGTDFHYQEYWGKVEGPEVCARIAGGIDLVTQTTQLSISRLSNEKSYDPIESLKQKISDNDHNLIEFTASKIKTNEADEKSINIKTHVPYVKNSKISNDLFSIIVSDKKTD